MSRRAVRKLVGAVLGLDDGSDGHFRRVALGIRAELLHKHFRRRQSRLPKQYLHANRRNHDHGTCGEERDTDCRICESPCRQRHGAD